MKSKIGNHIRGLSFIIGITHSKIVGIMPYGMACDAMRQRNGTAVLSLSNNIYLIIFA
jgi:hypothetical protein